MTIKTISGYVVSFEGRTIAKAGVFYQGKQIATTDKIGHFEISTGGFGKRNALTFVAEGFMTNTVIVNSQTAFIRPVILAKIGYEASFEAEKGATLKFGKTKFSIPANVFVDAKGKPAKGKIRFEFTLLDTSDELQLAAAMGDFTGRMLDGKEVKLRSFGIMQMRAYSEKGQPMEIAPKAEIKAAIRVPEKLREAATSRTGLFDFDVRSGIWTQTGWAVFNADDLVYTAVFNRINGGWNLDNPTQVTCVTIQLVDYYNQPLLFAGMSVTAIGNGYSTNGYTNASGKVCLLVAQNDNLTINIYGTNYGSYWTNQNAPGHITSPGHIAGAGDCGDPVKCPVFPVKVDLIVGFKELQILK